MRETERITKINVRTDRKRCGVQLDTITKRERENTMDRVRERERERERNGDSERETRRRIETSNLQVLSRGNKRAVL